MLLDLRSNYGGGNELVATSLKRSHASLSAFDPAGGHCQPTPLPETPGHPWASLGQSLVGSLLPSPGSWCTRFCLCPLRVYFPLLCKFWQLYGGVNEDLFQEDLCHTQVCCTQSPCPCSSPLLTHTSTGDTQTQFCPVSLGSLGPGVHKASPSP